MQGGSKDDWQPDRTPQYQEKESAREGVLRAQFLDDQALRQRIEKHKPIFTFIINGF